MRETAGSSERFTNIRSLLAAMAEAMNLINPDMESHHEQTAYLTWHIAQAMDVDDDLKQLAVYAALLHDVGSILIEKPQSVEEIEADARRVAATGAEMLRDLDGFSEIALLIEFCQCSWQETKACAETRSERCRALMRMASVIHLADTVSVAVKHGQPILNQVPKLREMIRDCRGRLFEEEAVDAFLRVSELEFIWFDLMNHPDFLHYFMGNIRDVSLAETVRMTKVMSRLIDYRSPFTAMHSAGVAASARCLASFCGLSEEEIAQIEIAGNLHDIGKLMIPRAILEKPGRLTDEEFNIIREHPYHTRLILMKVDGFEKICNWAGFHHEKLSGAGYPFHFKGEELDKGSRIMAVADIFSAITEERPYRKGMTKEETMRVLNDNAKSGGICDHLVGLLFDHYDEVDAARDLASHEAGRRYFASLKGRDAA